MRKDVVYKLINNAIISRILITPLISGKANVQTVNKSNRYLHAVLNPNGFVVIISLPTSY